jgi:hypothetical protein
MSNATALIASITTFEEAATAFGYAKDADGWTRRPKTPMKDHELAFGIVNRVAVENDFTSVESMTRTALVNQLGNPGHDRLLVRTDVPILGYQFPTDYRDLDAWELTFIGKHSQVMYVGGQYNRPWMVVDVRDDEVVGFAWGSFQEMFKRFVNATHVDMEISYRRWLTDLGTDALKDRHHQALNRHAARIKYERDLMHKKIRARGKQLTKNLIWIHDSLDTIAIMESGSSDRSVTYRLRYPAALNSATNKKISKPVVAASWGALVDGHRGQMQTHEAALAYRTVNNVEVPYAIWDQSKQLWELL